MENQSFLKQNLVLRRFPNPLFPSKTQESSVRGLKPTNPLHMLFIYKQSAEYISKRASQQAGEVCFSTMKLKQELKGWQMVLQKAQVSQDSSNFMGFTVSFLAVMCVSQSQFFSRLKGVKVPNCLFFKHSRTRLYPASI